VMVGILGPEAVHKGRMGGSNGSISRVIKDIILREN
jgi:hypothetical protein